MPPFRARCPITNVSAIALFGLLAALAVGCDHIPRDPEGSFEQARSRGLRVGIAAAPPWVTSVSPPSGVEPKLVEDFAAARGVDVEWITGGCEELLEVLENHGVDVVVCGLTEKGPWSKRVGMTRPYFKERRYLPGDDRKKPPRKHARSIAVEPGENRLLVELETWLYDNREHVTRVTEEGLGR